MEASVLHQELLLRAAGFLLGHLTEEPVDLGVGHIPLLNVQRFVVVIESAVEKNFPKTGLDALRLPAVDRLRSPL